METQNFVWRNVIAKLVAPDALTLVLLALAWPAHAQQAPARDATSGTASIMGVVVNDEERPQPIGHAIVTLTGDGLRPSRDAVTDDEGKFAIANLPAGRFTLIVSRASYVTSAYGAKRPGRLGTPIVVANGERVTGVTVRLWRGAVVAGVIRDENGAVVPGTPVRAIPAKAPAVGSLATLTNNGAPTNESGEYRIFGLEPGMYIVSAEVGVGSSRTTDLREAELLLVGLKRLAGTLTPETPPNAPLDLSPVYYPAAVTPSQATPLTLSAGQELGGIDLTLRRVRMPVFTGRVMRPDGTPASGALIQLTPEIPPSSFGGIRMPSLFETVGANGEFRIGQVASGRYQLLAIAPAGPQPKPAPGIATPGPQGPPLWASGALTIAGADVGGIVVTVEPGFTVSGQLVFQSDRLRPPANSAVKVNIIRASGALQKPGPIEALTFVPAVAVAPDGSFEIQYLGPGPHRLIVSGAPLTDGTWFVQSAVMGGRDVFEGDFEIRGSGSDAMTVTLTDKVTELTGVMQTESRAPAPSDVFVIAFSANREHWRAGTRRIQAVRPGVDGRYVIRGLPAGDYFIAAVLDIDQDDWNVPGFLDQLVPASIKVGLGPGEKKTQDLRIGR